MWLDTEKRAVLIEGCTLWGHYWRCSLAEGCIGCGVSGFLGAPLVTRDCVLC